MFQIYRGPQRTLQLATIGFKYGSAVVLEKVAVFRVYDGRDTTPLGSADSVRDDGGAEYSLVIVFQDHRICLPHSYIDRGDYSGSLLARKVVVLFFVKPE